MHFRSLDLNLLVALDALLTECNITQAGKRVYLTQSAMSGALARLREYFHDELLVQVGRKMVPTPLGQSLAKPVRDILLQIQATLQTRPTFDPATAERRFTLMMSDYVASVLMPDLLRHIEPLAPQVQIVIVSNDVESPAEALARGDVDFLIMPEQFLAPGHPWAPLFEDTYVCIASSDHPQIGDTITLDQYLSLGHVAVRFNQSRNPAVEEFMIRRLGHVRRIEVFATTFSSVPALIVGTRRIATVHRRIAERYAKILPLKILPAPLELPPLIERIQWHQYLDADPSMMWMREQLTAIAARLGAAAP
ncbi:MAG: LysR family transcriptional regulator [Steroidobacteraceae bacterium]|nr:LysR family transcriptional regulator [Steroidobacteraceae bacterium]MDW8260002.1 LysR family transcriptional regulator [Gammaproteobacteria bacterium]